jgi:hypothetical protein
MNFSHGRARTMTRSCSCTARLLSTLLLAVHHTARVRVLLSSHDITFPSCPPLPCSPASLMSRLSLRFPWPLPLISCSHSACRTSRFRWLKFALTNIDDFVTTLSRPLTNLHASLFLLLSRDTLCSRLYFSCAYCLRLLPVTNWGCYFAGNRALPQLCLLLIPPHSTKYTYPQSTLTVVAFLIVDIVILVCGNKVIG